MARSWFLVLLVHLVHPLRGYTIEANTAPARSPIQDMPWPVFNVLLAPNETLLSVTDRLKAYNAWREATTAYLQAQGASSTSDYQKAMFCYPGPSIYAPAVDELPLIATCEDVLNVYNKTTADAEVLISQSQNPDESLVSTIARLLQSEEINKKVNENNRKMLDQQENESSHGPENTAGTQSHGHSISFGSSQRRDHPSQSSVNNDEWNNEEMRKISTRTGDLHAREPDISGHSPSFKNVLKPMEHHSGLNSRKDGETEYHYESFIDSLEQGKLHTFSEDQLNSSDILHQIRKGQPNLAFDPSKTNQSRLEELLEDNKENWKSTLANGVVSLPNGKLHAHPESPYNFSDLQDQIEDHQPSSASNPSEVNNSYLKELLNKNNEEWKSKQASVIDSSVKGESHDFSEDSDKFSDSTLQIKNHKLNIAFDPSKINQTHLKEFLDENNGARKNTLASGIFSLPPGNLHAHPEDTDNSTELLNQKRAHQLNVSLEPFKINQSQLEEFLDQNKEAWENTLTSVIVSLPPGNLHDHPEDTDNSSELLQQTRDHQPNVALDSSKTNHSDLKKLFDENEGNWRIELASVIVSLPNGNLRANPEDTDNSSDLLHQIRAHQPNVALNPAKINRSHLKQLFDDSGGEWENALASAIVSQPNENLHARPDDSENSRDSQHQIRNGQPNLAFDPSKIYQSRLEELLDENKGNRNSTLPSVIVSLLKENLRTHHEDTDNSNDLQHQIKDHQPNLVLDPSKFNQSHLEELFDENGGEWKNALASVIDSLVNEGSHEFSEDPDNSSKLLHQVRDHQPNLVLDPSKFNQSHLEELFDENGGEWKNALASVIDSLVNEGSHEFSEDPDNSSKLLHQVRDHQPNLVLDPSKFNQSHLEELFDENGGEWKNALASVIDSLVNEGSHEFSEDPDNSSKLLHQVRDHQPNLVLDPSKFNQSHLEEVFDENGGEWKNALASVIDSLVNEGSHEFSEDPDNSSKLLHQVRDHQPNLVLNPSKFNQSHLEELFDENGGEWKNALASVIDSLVNEGSHEFSEDPDNSSKLLHQVRDHQPNLVLDPSKFNQSHLEELFDENGGEWKNALASVIDSLENEGSHEFSEDPDNSSELLHQVRDHQPNLVLHPFKFNQSHLEELFVENGGEWRKALESAIFSLPNEYLHAPPDDSNNSSDLQHRNRNHQPNSAIDPLKVNQSILKELLDKNNGEWKIALASVILSIHEKLHAYPEDSNNSTDLLHQIKDYQHNSASDPSKVNQSHLEKLFNGNNGEWESKLANVNDDSVKTDLHIFNVYPDISSDGPVDRSYFQSSRGEENMTSRFLVTSRKFITTLKESNQSTDFVSSQSFINPMTKTSPIETDPKVEEAVWSIFKPMNAVIGHLPGQPKLTKEKESLQSTKDSTRINQINTSYPMKENLKRVVRAANDVLQSSNYTAAVSNQIARLSSLQAIFPVPNKRLAVLIARASTLLVSPIVASGIFSNLTEDIRANCNLNSTIARTEMTKLLDALMAADPVVTQNIVNRMFASGVCTNRTGFLDRVTQLIRNQTLLLSIRNRIASGNMTSTMEALRQRLRLPSSPPAYNTGVFQNFENFQSGFQQGGQRLGGDISTFLNRSAGLATGAFTNVASSFSSLFNVLGRKR